MRGILLVAVALFVALGSPARSSAADAVPAECPEFFFADLGEVDCFTLAVPERHGGADAGGEIELFVSILRASGDDTEPDPIVFLAGGPGAVAAEAAPVLAASTLRKTRDIILLEQRGTALTDPYLGCPALDQHQAAYAAYPGSDADFVEAITASAQACADTYTAEGIDLGAFNTAESAADVEAVREALDIEGWNLYGISYGTRLGLEVIRRNPASVRSAVFDSVLPAGFDLYRDRTMWLAEALARAERACEADVACRDRYGDLDDLYLRAFERLDAQPIEVYASIGPDVVAPVLVDGGMVASTVYTDLVTAPGRLPLDLAALAEGQTHIVEAQFLGGGLLAEGLRLSVECSERFAYLDRDAQRASDTSAPDLALVFRRFPESAACSVWPVDPAPAELNEPVSSDVPVLLIAGELDPITPPLTTEIAAQTLSGSWIHVVPRGGHGSGATDRCATELRDRFLDDPSQEPDFDCDDAGPFVTDVALHARMADGWLQVMGPPRVGRPPFEAIFVVLAGLLASALVIGIWRLTRRSGSRAWLLAVVACGLVLALGAAIGWVWSIRDPVVVGAYGLPAALAWLPWVGLLAAVTVALLAIAVVEAWLRRRPSGRQRLYLTAVTMAAAAALWLMAGWGMVGFG